MVVDDPSHYRNQLLPEIKNNCTLSYFKATNDHYEAGITGVMQRSGECLHVGHCRPWTRLWIGLLNALWTFKILCFLHATHSLLL